MGTLGWMLAAVGSITLGLFGAWIRSELSVWQEPLIRFLVHQAASKMPADISAEIEAEWLAWISDTRSPTMKLLSALHFFGCAWQSRRALYETSKFSTNAQGSRVFLRGFSFRTGVKIGVLVASSTLLAYISYVFYRNGMLDGTGALTVIAVVISLFNFYAAVLQTNHLLKIRRVEKTFGGKVLSFVFSPK